MNWDTIGVYKLLPPKPAKPSPEFCYEELVFNDTVVVSLRETSLRITAAWTIVEPWSIKRAALCSPTDDSVAIKKKCSDIFLKNTAFKEFFTTFMLKGDDAPDDEEERGATSTPTKPSQIDTPTSLRKQLSGRQREALAGLRILASGST